MAPEGRVRILRFRGGNPVGKLVASYMKADAGGRDVFGRRRFTFADMDRYESEHRQHRT